MNPRYLLPALILLSGCQSMPNTTALPADSTSSVIQEPTPVDPIQKAALDIAIARESGVIWMVRDTSTGQNPVSLEQLLEQAGQAYDAGDTQESHRLALKVSTMVALALEQDQLNSTARPQYSFQDQ
jgi:hypothetical protein